MTRILLVFALLAPNEAARRAEKHFAAGEYEEAVAALREAYAHEPDPAFVFAEGSALQELGRCQQAIVVYERFLALAPGREQAQKAFARIQTCRSQLGSKTPPPPPPPEPVEEPDVEPDVESFEDDGATAARPWHRDPVGGVLLGVGLAAAVGGGALVGVGASRRGSASDAMTEGAFRDDLQGTNTMQGVGIGLLVTGGALLVGAIVRYAIVRRRGGSAMSNRRRTAPGPLSGWLRQLHPSTPG